MPRFLLLYALAWAGAAIAYVPFLSILLPVRVAGLAGSADVSWLAYIAFAGAVAASAGHIAFGYLSDVTGNRRGWIWAGLILSCTLLFAVTRARDLTTLIGLIVGWQLALNMMLAPLAALAGDRVPDRHKGLLGGLMAFAPGLGALSGAAVTIPGLALPDARLALVAGIVACCVSPVLLVRLPPRLPDPPADADAGPRRLWHGAMPRMWLARLAVQIAEAELFAYLFVWLRSLDPTMSDNQTARVFSAVLILSAPLALLGGRWADRQERPLLPLVICAGISACGLAGMALSGSLHSAIAAYALFGVASSVFLALHSAQTLRVLPRSDRRGRDLGLFNLTNTLPSLIMPWLTLALVPWFGFAGLFVVFAALALCAGLLLTPLIRHT